MTDVDATPVWARPAATLEGWPTAAATDDDLGYALHRPEHWSADPERSENPMEVEHVYRGPLTGECLSVARMGKADPKADMRGWVGGLLAITGTPNLAMWAGMDEPPTMNEWTPRGGPEALQRRLKLDEVHAFDGHMTFSVEPATSVRVYVLLGRRGQVAWKVFLSISSACPPGSDWDTIVANDHGRAAQIFGNLTLG